MLYKRSILTLLGAVTLCALTASQALAQLPQQCKTHHERITINLLNVDTIPGVKTTYSYEMLGSVADIYKVRGVVAVITRPILPANIIGPEGIRVGGFCRSSDLFRINKGDCESFTVVIPTTKVSPTRRVFSLESDIPNQGTITLNVGIPGWDHDYNFDDETSDWQWNGWFRWWHHSRYVVLGTCVAMTDEGPRGIAGPGGEYTPAAAVAVNSCFSAGACQVCVNRDFRGAITSVVPQGDCTLEVNGAPIGGLMINGQNAISVPDDTVLGASASPACYYWFYGGRYYQICEPPR